MDPDWVLGPCFFEHPVFRFSGNISDLETKIKFPFYCFGEKVGGSVVSTKKGKLHL